MSATIVAGAPAEIRAVPQSAGATAPVPTVSAAPRFEVREEELGGQSIEGVMALGHRTTHTYPTGSVGNDRPFQSTAETWSSPELRLVVMSKNADPRSGETTFKLTNIDRSEPPATLFQPPPDYTVVDETGLFEIQWTAPRQP